MFSFKLFEGFLSRSNNSSSSAKASQSNNQQPTNVYTTQEDPELYKNDKYHFLLPPIGSGGFSNVLAAKPKRKRAWRSGSLSVPSLRKKSFVEKLESYNLAAKVCELNGEKFQVSEEEYLLSLAGGVNLYDHMMQVADINELQQEVQMMRELQVSGYVVKLIDAFEYTPNQQYWMVMERMTTTLTDLTCKGTWKKHPDARVCVLREVLEALIFLKSKRIVHGDIKPSNVLVDKSGAVKLCDFGIAQKIEEEGGKLIVKETRGSYPYMAPELFIEGYEYDYAIDVWSFGWVIYSTYTNNSRSAFENRQLAQDMRFRDYEWECWARSDAAYFEVILGPDYVTQAERDQIREESARRRKAEPEPDWLPEPSKEYLEWDLACIQESDEKANLFNKENVLLIQLLRGILIPAEGSDGTVMRESCSSRSSLNEISVAEYFADIKNLNRQAQQQQIRKLF